MDLVIDSLYLALFPFFVESFNVKLLWFIIRYVYPEVYIQAGNLALHAGLNSYLRLQDIFA